MDEYKKCPNCGSEHIICDEDDDIDSATCGELVWWCEDCGWDDYSEY